MASIRKRERDVMNDGVSESKLRCSFSVEYSCTEREKEREYDACVFTKLAMHFLFYDANLYVSIRIAESSLIPRSSAIGGSVTVDVADAAGTLSF